MLTAELHQVFDACRDFDENAFDAMHGFSIVADGDFLVAVAGALAVREHVMVGECLAEPLQHGLAEIIFDDTAVTVFVDVAEQELAACEFVEDEFHVFFVEFGETVFGVEFGGEAHLDELRLNGFGQEFSVPIFLFDFFTPSVDGELLEFFENLG